MELQLIGIPGFHRYSGLVIVMIISRIGPHVQETAIVRTRWPCRTIAKWQSDWVRIRTFIDVNALILYRFLAWHSERNPTTQISFMLISLKSVLDGLTKILNSENESQYTTYSTPYARLFLKRMEYSQNLMLLICFLQTIIEFGISTVSPICPRTQYIAAFFFFVSDISNYRSW